MRFVEMIFALAEKGYRVGFYQTSWLHVTAQHSSDPNPLGDAISLVVCDENGELLASYNAVDEDELVRAIENAWQNYG